MFKRFFIIFIICLFASPIYAQTQSEMIDMAIIRSNNEQIKLNKFYSSVLNSFSMDKNFVKNLEKAQISWEKYKEKQLKALFPEKNKEIIYNYGSNYEIYFYSYYYDLTTARISELKKIVQLKCLYISDKTNFICEPNNLKKFLE